MPQTSYLTATTRDRGLDIAAWLLTLVCVAVIVSFPLFDYDLYWHLANGRAMLAQGRIVNEEIFSYTRAGVPFVNHEWLAQIIFYTLYQATGAVGLNVAKSLFSCGVAAVLYRGMRLLGVVPILAAGLTVAAVLVGLFRYNLRPELFSLLGVAILGYVLHGFRAGVLGPRALFALPLTLLLWDWLHGAVFGVLLLVAFAAAENAKAWLAARTATWTTWAPLPGDRLRRLNLALLATAGVMLLNPYGLRTYGIFFQFAAGNPLVAVVEEFAAPGWADYPAFWFLLLALLTLMVVRWRRLDPTHVLLALPFVVMAVRYSRATGAFALVAAPILGVLLTGAWQDLRARLWPRRLLQAGLLLGILALLLHGTQLKFFRAGWTHSFGLAVSDDYTPLGSLRFVEDVGLAGNLYNSGNFGGYLAFFAAPQRPIFQYNHHTVFGDTTRFLAQPGELASWGINYAIVGLPAELDILFPRAQWARVYREGPAVVVLRRTAANQALIQRYEQLYFHPARAPAELRALARRPASYQRLLEEMADYLAYREDAPLAALFAELWSQPPRPTESGWREQVLRQARRANTGDHNLRRLHVENDNPAS